MAYWKVINAVENSKSVGNRSVRIGGWHAVLNMTVKEGLTEKKQSKRGS